MPTEPCTCSTCAINSTLWSLKSRLDGINASITTHTTAINSLTQAVESLKTGFNAFTLAETEEDAEENETQNNYFDILKRGIESAIAAALNAQTPLTP